MSNSKPSRALIAARGDLEHRAKQIADDPQVNSVFGLARSIFSELESGKLGLATAEDLIDEVHLSLADQRSDAFRSQHKVGHESDAWDAVKARLSRLADQGWEPFRSAVEAPNGGIVFTAHPTFALPLEARRAFTRHVLEDDANSKTALGAALAQDARDWSASISLSGEHAEVQEALIHAQDASRRYAECVLETAKDRFPDTWTYIKPALPTLASWVGYDLDGRSDIEWWHSLAFRLSEKASQLQRYAQHLRVIADQGADIGALAEKLERASQVSAAEAELFSEDLSNPDLLVAAASALTSENPDRLTDAAEILGDIDKSLATAPEDTHLALCTLRAEVAMLQLGTARIHLRVNAAQVRAVISRDLGLETEDRELGRVALEELSKRAGAPEACKANFADLFLERSTARRQIMMCALMLKHIDAGSDIRFLIAEAENPATVMGALYLARQYGVAGKLDISPLFETPEALETGGRFIQRLLEEPAFLAYLRERGYLSIQLGFSDAGRFIGQVAADMAIERIHNLIARALSAKGEDLGLLIFNTHGESMGRGAWPGTFEDRFNHVLTPWTRCRAREYGLKLRHEVSFQGGDGFLHFASPELAAATYGAYCLHLLSEPGDCREDPFYTQTGFVWDTYRSLRSWHERLFNDADYGRLLSDFATNFLVRAGSRQRRRTGGPTGPRSLRAISHNATLQQLGVPVNTAAGIGSTIRRETDRLVALLDGSPRLRHLLMLAVKARLVTSVPALRAYAGAYDPSFWVAVARTAEPEQGVAYRRIYYALREQGTAHALRRTADRFSIDLSKFDRLLSRMKEAPSVAERHAARLDVHVLHAYRIGLMMHAFALAGRVPTLSDRKDANLAEFMSLVLEMRIGEAAGMLDDAFPASSPEMSALDTLRDGSAGRDAQGYDELHADIITPLKEIDRLLHKTTLAISHSYGAYG
ncbi:MAG: phosphoenolpyruvate carboxylase [Pseudomonadota bacterium]